MIDLAATTRYPRLASWFYGQCWALAPESLLQLEALLQAHMAGWRPSAEEIAAATGARRNGGSPAATGVAVLPVRGVISPRAELLTESSGGTSVEALTRALRRGVADPAVGAIILDVDSPGGSVFGIEELAAEIAAANRQKPLVAVANASAASAAYWLASQASELSVTPSGEVGSIGVLALHEDVSGLQAQKGVATTLVTAGTFKGEGNPFEPLGAEGRQALQARVDAYYGAFTRAVAHGRRVAVADVRGGMGEGRMVGAREAVRLGMADRVETLDQAVVRVAQALAKGEWPAAVAAEHWLPPIAAASDGGAPMVAGPIAPHATATTDAAWDGPSNEARLSTDAGEATYRRAYAWQDDDGDPDAKASFRFIHHMVGADGAVGAANTKACSTGIGVLNGGRGGSTIPSADREGVHRHLTKHLRDAGLEPPPLALADGHSFDVAAGPREGASPTPPVLLRRRLLLRARAVRP